MAPVILLFNNVTSLDTPTPVRHHPLWLSTGHKGSPQERIFVIGGKTARFSILSDVKPNFAVLRKNPKTFKEAE